MAEYNAGPIRAIPREEEELYDQTYREFMLHVTDKTTFNNQYEEVAELILPSHRGTFQFGSVSTPGDKKTEKQVDATGMMALSRFAAICDSLLTPRNMIWHGLTANDEYVMKDRDTQLWFEDTTRRLFRQRYAPMANFSQQNQATFQSLGAFGTGAMLIDQLVDHQGVPVKGLRYRSVPLGEIYLIENHQGLIIGFFRHFRLTAAQAWSKTEWRDRFPEQLKEALAKKSLQKFDFVQHVAPRSDYDKGRFDAKGKPFKSCYISLQGRCVLQEGGYRSLPISASRYEQAPGEVYGRGPAMSVLPSLKTLNAEKRTFLKQGHRAGDPVLLTQDDGLLDLSLRPGAINKGGWSSDGRPLVGILPTGEIQVTLEMMQEEKALINDAFLVSLFSMMLEKNGMTATEVIERVNERGILVAPTVGAQQSSYLGPLIDRELDELAFQGLLAPMPPRLREAGGSYSVVYTSPISKAARAQEAAGFMRSVEYAISVVNITQDPSYLDPFNFDRALPEIADIHGVPENWMSSEDEIGQRRQTRAEAQKRQEAIQAAPAAAALQKADVAAAQAGAPA